MERTVNIDSIVSVFYFHDYDSLNKMINLIIEREETYFFIQDEFEKILDVSQMPDYIKKDWIKYNSQVLNLSVVNKHIENLKKSIKEIEYTSTEKENTLKKVLDRVLSIRRDFIINGIL